MDRRVLARSSRSRYTARCDSLLRASGRQPYRHVSATHVPDSSPRTEPSAKARPKNAIQAMTLRSLRLRCVVPRAVLMAHPCSQPLQLKPSMRATLPASRRHLSSYEMCFASGLVQQDIADDLFEHESADGTSLAVRRSGLDRCRGQENRLIGRWLSTDVRPTRGLHANPRHKKPGPRTGPVWMTLQPGVVTA